MRVTGGARGAQAVFLGSITRVWGNAKRTGNGPKDGGVLACGGGYRTGGGGFRVFGRCNRGVTGQ